MNIGKSLKVAMAIHGISNKKLAKDIKESEVNVSRWRSDYSGVDNTKLNILAGYFDMKVSEFIALGEDK